MDPEWHQFMDTVIAGVAHAIRDNGLKPEVHMPFGAELRVVREPGNAFDHHACRLDTDSGQKCGYIPATQAAWLSRLMDAGVRVRAVVGVVERARNTVTITLEVQAPTYR